MKKDRPPVSADLKDYLKRNSGFPGIIVSGFFLILLGYHWLPALDEIGRICVYIASSVLVIGLTIHTIRVVLLSFRMSEEEGKYKLMSSSLIIWIVAVLSALLSLFNFWR